MPLLVPHPVFGAKAGAVPLRLRLPYRLQPWLVLRMNTLQERVHIPDPFVCSKAQHGAGAFIQAQCAGVQSPLPPTHVGVLERRTIWTMQSTAAVLVIGVSASSVHTSPALLVGDTFVPAGMLTGIPAMLVVRIDATTVLAAATSRVTFPIDAVLSSPTPEALLISFTTLAYPLVSVLILKRQSRKSKNTRTLPI